MLSIFKFKSRLWVLAIVVCGLCGPAAGQEAQAPVAPKQRQLQQRIDFGNSYIMGQSIKSGAVYLLHRKQSTIKSMLQIRTDYREEIKEDYALEGTELVTAAQKPSEEKLK